MTTSAQFYSVLDRPMIKESLGRALLSFQPFALASRVVAPGVRALKKAVPYSPVAGTIRGMRQYGGKAGLLDAGRLGRAEAAQARYTKNMRRQAALADAAKAESEALGRLAGKKPRPPKTDNKPPKTDNKPPKTDNKPPKTDNKPPKTDTTPPKTDTTPKTTALQDFLASSKRVAKENPVATAAGLGLGGLGLGYLAGDSGGDNRRRMVIL